MGVENEPPETVAKYLLSRLEVSGTSSTSPTP